MSAYQIVRFRDGWTVISPHGVTLAWFTTLLAAEMFVTEYDA